VKVDNLYRQKEIYFSTANQFNIKRWWHISASYDFTLGKVGLRVLAEINNLLSQDYDVILNYPMPKRNYRFTLSVEI